VSTPLTQEILDGFDRKPKKAFKGKTDLMLVFDDEQDVRNINPNHFLYRPVWHDHLRCSTACERNEHPQSAWRQFIGNRDPVFQKVSFPCRIGFCVGHSFYHGLAELLV